MQNTSQPLINRTQILQDESLLSLLIRLTTLNFYELPVVLRGIVLEDPNTLSYFRDDLEFPLKSTTYEKLTSLTQLDIRFPIQDYIASFCCDSHTPSLHNSVFSTADRHHCSLLSQRIFL